MFGLRRPRTPGSWAAVTPARRCEIRPAFPAAVLRSLFTPVIHHAYGTPLEPARIDAHAKVFSALCHLGFRESAVKAVLRELRAHAELAASAEHLLREALRRIRPTAR